MQERLKRGASYCRMGEGGGCSQFQLRRHEARASLNIFYDRHVTQGDSVPDPEPDPHVFGPPGSFYHQAKIVRKTLIPTDSYL